MQQRLNNGLPENPAKVGIASTIRLDPQGDFVTAGPARRLIYTTQATPADTINQLKALGVEVLVHQGERVDLIRMLADLKNYGFNKIMLEGGSTIISEFIRLGLADELRLYLAAKVFGGENAPALVGGSGWPASAAKSLKLESVKQFDAEGGILLHYLFPIKN